MSEVIPAPEWAERARALAKEGWELIDLAGLDRLRIGPPERRFEIVVQFLHTERRERISLHIAAEGDPPTVPSVADMFPTVNFMEREAFDMYGISFEGHPNLTRILMPDEWEGYPLRKDYGVGKIPVEFVEQPLMQISSVGQAPDALESRAQVDHLGQVIEEEVNAP